MDVKLVVPMGPTRKRRYKWAFLLCVASLVLVVVTIKEPVQGLPLVYINSFMFLASISTIITDMRITPARLTLNDNELIVHYLTKNNIIFALEDIVSLEMQLVKVKFQFYYMVVTLSDGTILRVDITELMPVKDKLRELLTQIITKEKHVNIGDELFNLVW